MSEHFPATSGFRAEHQDSDGVNKELKTANELAMEREGLWFSGMNELGTDTGERRQSDGKYKIDAETRNQFGTDIVPSRRELSGELESSDNAAEAKEDGPFDPETLTPPGWTLLKYGADTAAWPDLDSRAVIELEDDMEAVTRETEERDKRDGSDPVRANARAGKGKPVEIDVVFPAQDVSSQLETMASSAQLQSRLKEGQQGLQELVDRTYYKNWQQGRQPMLPKGLVLEKIGQHYDEETAREVHYFIPEVLADVYATDLDYKLEGTAGYSIRENEITESSHEQSAENDTGKTADQFHEREEDEEGLTGRLEISENMQESQEPSESSLEYPEAEADRAFLPETNDKLAEESPEQSPDMAPGQEEIGNVGEFTRKLAENMSYFKQYAENLGMGDSEVVLQNAEAIIASFSPEEQREFVDKVYRMAASSELQSLQNEQSTLNHERPDPNGSMVQQVADGVYRQVLEEVVRPLSELARADDAK